MVPKFATAEIEDEVPGDGKIVVDKLLRISDYVASGLKQQESFMRAVRAKDFVESEFPVHYQVLMAMSLSLLKFVGQASLVDDAMLPS